MGLSNADKENIRNLLRHIFSPIIKKSNAKLVFDGRFDDIERHFQVTGKHELIKRLERLKVLIEYVFVLNDFWTKVAADYQIHGKMFIYVSLYKGH